MNVVNQWLIDRGLEDTTHHRVFWIVLGSALGALLTSAVFLILPDASLENLGIWFGNTAQGIGTELIGALFTFILVERIMDSQRETRRKEEEEERIKRDQRSLLIVDLIGQSDKQAERALEILRQNGWLTDGKLKSQNLRGARLKGAHLSQANLENAWLYEAQLGGANLYQTILHKANLSTANLEEAILDGTDLRGANLRKCYLKNARLRNIHCDEDTVLPDGHHWSSETDMDKFTDPDHADYYDLCTQNGDMWYCEV